MVYISASSWFHCCSTVVYLTPSGFNNSYCFSLFGLIEGVFKSPWFGNILFLMLVNFGTCYRWDVSRVVVSASISCSLEGVPQVWTTIFHVLVSFRIKCYPAFTVFFFFPHRYCLEEERVTLWVVLVVTLGEGRVNLGLASCFDT